MMAEWVTMIDQSKEPEALPDIPQAIVRRDIAGVQSCAMSRTNRTLRTSL
jgi:hypothetical protein